ncbi:MAG: biotin/lipoyl-binding protein, partial [Pseudomonadales bacterium]|nr:biotin/lipoyl-binding protein [Pseudomonadales bacterium]
MGIVVVLAAVGLYANSQRTAVVQVSVVQVARGDVIASVTNTRAGTVDACRRAGIAPATGGNITGLYVKDGDVVVKDQLLLELWNADLRARVLLAQQDAAASESMSRQSCVTAGVAKRVADRLVQLKKGGLASQEAVERAVGEAESAEAACKASRDVIKVRQAGVEVANATLLRTQLRAPFDGVIAEINGELGEWVTPSPVGIPTPPTV